jgi:hypothetical protein
MSGETAQRHVPEAFFEHPENVAINEAVFGHLRRSAELTRKIHNMADMLKRTLYDFVERFAIDILVIENALCIPVHIPLGIALTNFLAETGFPAIAHHHDFYWERSRFLVNAVGDYLQMAFPPALPMIQHVTINTFGQQELAHRKGCPSELIPNVLDFEAGPPAPDNYAKDLRGEIGLEPYDILVLQPTRVVPRKGIELAINLVAQLKDSRLKLVVTHESGDEAHMVYQFSLPPLLLDAFVTRDSRPLMDWLTQLEPAPASTTFLNFTASHDGIGLRPLEDLIPPERRDRLVSAACATGGAVSTRRKLDGTDSPYELNVSYFSALGTPPGLPAVTHVRRFLATQAVMLTLRGIPAVYFHSLVGTPNDVLGFQRTCRARSINRHKFDWDELQALLMPAESIHRQVLDSYCRMLSVRVRQGAFHPDAAQEVVHLDSRSVISFVRTSVDGRQRILVVANVADTTIVVQVPPSFEQTRVSELFSMGATWQTDGHLSVAPAGVAWLARPQ